jgi:hypothetical protein
MAFKLVHHVYKQLSNEASLADEEIECAEMKNIAPNLCTDRYPYKEYNTKLVFKNGCEEIVVNLRKPVKMLDGPPLLESLYDRLPSISWDGFSTFPQNFRPPRHLTNDYTSVFRNLLHLLPQLDLQISVIAHRSGSSGLANIYSHSIITLTLLFRLHSWLLVYLIGIGLQLVHVEMRHGGALCFGIEGNPFI